MDILRKIGRALSGPGDMTSFLDLYTWEAAIFCIFSPLFLGVPILLFIYAIRFHFFICFLLILLALIITLPWLLVPYWIIHTINWKWWGKVIWGVCNASVVACYILLFNR